MSRPQSPRPAACYPPLRAIAPSLLPVLPSLKMPARKLTSRVKRFLTFFETTAQLDAVEAARMTGYTAPHQAASKLERIWFDKLEDARVRVRGKLVMDATETQQRIAAVARDITHKDHVRALELVARIHGLLSDKLDIKVSRGDVASHLGRALERIERAEIPAPSAIPLAIGDGSES